MDELVFSPEFVEEDQLIKFVPKSGHSKKISLEQEHLLVLMKSRLGLLTEDVALGAIPEKIRTCGVEVMEFFRVSKKEHVEISGVNYKRSGISRGVHKKLTWNFHG